MFKSGLLILDSALKVHFGFTAYEEILWVYTTPKFWRCFRCCWHIQGYAFKLISEIVHCTLLVPLEKLLVHLQAISVFYSFFWSLKYLFGDGIRTLVSHPCKGRNASKNKFLVLYYKYWDGITRNISCCFSFSHASIIMSYRMALNCEDILTI